LLLAADAGRFVGVEGHVRVHVDQAGQSGVFGEIDGFGPSGIAEASVVIARIFPPSNDYDHIGQYFSLPSQFAESARFHVLAAGLSWAKESVASTQ